MGIRSPNAHPGRKRPVASELACTAALLLTSCAPPTQIVVDIYSEIDCANNPQVGLFAGSTLAELGTKAPTSTAEHCEGPPGHVGSVVLQPSASGERDEEIAFQVATRNDSAGPDTCVAANDYAGCIVARRQVRFQPHRSIGLRVDLRLSCLDLPCDSGLARTFIGQTRATGR